MYFSLDPLLLMVLTLSLIGHIYLMGPEYLKGS